MPIITTTRGSENQKDSSVRVDCFVINPRTGQESPLFAAAKKSDFANTVEAVGNPVFLSARQGIKTEIGGQWVTGRYAIVEGMILKVNVSKRQFRDSRTSIFAVRVREQAAMQRFITSTTCSADSTAMDVVAVSGRFDLLTLDQLMNDFNVAVPPVYHRLYEPLMFSSLVTVRTDEQQIAPPPEFVHVTTLVDDSRDRLASRTRQVPSRAARTLDVMDAVERVAELVPELVPEPAPELTQEPTPTPEPTPEPVQENKPRTVIMPVRRRSLDIK